MASVNAARGEWGTIDTYITIPDSYSAETDTLFFETPWSGEPDKDMDLMDYCLDDVTLRTLYEGEIEKPKEGEYDYNGSNLKLEWQWNHNPDNTCWSLTERAGFLRIKNGKVVDDLVKARNILTQRTYGPGCTGSTAVETAGMKNGDYAGLAAFRGKYGYVAVHKENDKKYIVMTSVDYDGGGAEYSDKFKPVERERIEIGAETERVYFRTDYSFDDGGITSYANTVDFFYSIDGAEWKKIGTTLDMVYSLPHFMGYRFALFNFATEETGGYADFDYFRLNGDMSDNISATPALKITAEYENGVLTGCRTENIDYAGTVDTTGLRAGSKVFVWDSAEGLRPLSGVVEVK